MEYARFIEYNNRAKRICGSSNIVFLNRQHYLCKDNAGDLTKIKELIGDNVNEEELPEELYYFDVQKLGFFDGGTDEVVLGSIIASVVACKSWICNPEVLKEDGLIEVAEVMPSYAPISVVLGEEEDGDKSLYVSVNGIISAVCLMPELFGVSAVHDVYRKAVGNLRKYGFITTGTGIEGRLLSRINKVLSKDVPEYTKGVEIGPLKEGE